MLCPLSIPLHPRLKKKSFYADPTKALLYQMSKSYASANAVYRFGFCLIGIVSNSISRLILISNTLNRIDRCPERQETLNPSPGNGKINRSRPTAVYRKCFTCQTTVYHKFCGQRKVYRDVGTKQKTSRHSIAWPMSRYLCLANQPILIYVLCKVLYFCGGFSYVICRTAVPSTGARSPWYTVFWLVALLFSIIWILQMVLHGHILVQT